MDPAEAKLTTSSTSAVDEDDLASLRRVAEEFFSGSLTSHHHDESTSTSASRVSSLLDIISDSPAASSLAPVTGSPALKKGLRSIEPTKKKKKGVSYIGDIEEPFMVTDDVREHLLMAFEDLARQFIEASVEVWPRCPVLNRWLTEFTEGATEVPDTVPGPFKVAYGRRKYMHQLIMKFHTTFNDFYVAISDSNPSVIFDSMESESEETIRLVQPLIDLNVREKYESAHSSVQTTVMMYMQQLCQFSNMYALCNKFPDNAMQSIFAMSRGLESKLKKGEMALSDFNLDSLRDIGKSIVEGMNESSVDRLTRALTSDGGLENMVMMMSSMVSNMSGGAVNTSGISEILGSAPTSTADD